MNKTTSTLALAVALSVALHGGARAAACKVGVAMYTLSAPYFAAQVAAAADEAKKASLWMALSIVSSVVDLVPTISPSFKPRRGV